MFVKNSLRLLINNLNLCYKTMLYRLIVFVPAFFASFAICKAGFVQVFKSAEFTTLWSKIGDLFNAFSSGDFRNAVDIGPYLDGFVGMLRSTAPSLLWRGVAAVAVWLVASVLLGVCDYTSAVIVDTYMNSISKMPFVQTMIRGLKKSVVFELVYSLLRTFVFVIILTVCTLFAVFAFSFLSFLSVMVAIWMLVMLYSLFLTWTSRLRTQVVHGAKLLDAFKNVKYPKKKFWYVVASYVFAVVAVLYLNISMCVMTFFSGLLVSLPLSAMFIVTLQLVIDYSVEGKKYYVDFDNIVVPKELREDGEKLLSDVDI